MRQELLEDSKEEGYIMLRGILFFSAFFSVAWLLFLGVFWLEHHRTTLKNVRERARIAYEIYVAGTGIKNQFFKCLSAVVYAHVLFPTTGIIIALILIAGFIFFRHI